MMPRILAFVLTSTLASSVAAADAHETSVHLQAMGGVAQVADPVAQSASRVSFGGASLRFTWATRDWLAYEVIGYGAATRRQAHDVVIAGEPRSFERRIFAVGVDAGIAVRLGVRFIPTAGVGVGPQLASAPSAPLFDTAGGIAVDTASSVHELDLTIRGFAGFDFRATRRLMLGVRGTLMQSAGISGLGWQSAQLMVHAGYHWYPRWWFF